jgi:hypothetical protein
VDTPSLLEAVEAEELLYEAPSLYAWQLGAVSNAEGVAQFMYRGGPFPPQASASRKPPPEDPRPEKRYWEFVKTEMQTFLCTDDKRYKSLWKQIEELKKRSTTAIVGVIAAYLGASIGVAATLLSGFVAVCLYAVIKVGKEAYCNYVARDAA